MNGLNGSTNHQSKIMVVDDNELNLELATDLLESADYQVAQASDGEGALAYLEQNNGDVDLILLDVMMPGLDGYETCQRIKDHQVWRLIPVVMLTALSDVNNRVKALEAGADDFLSKPFNEDELLARVKTSAQVKQLHDQLEDTENILFALANVVEVKDHFTDHHLKRMAHFSESLARLVGLSEIEQRHMRFGGILHDIGKVGISDTILRKPGKLTPEEYEIIKEHTVLGEQIVQPMRFGAQVGPMVRGHHERWDGGGYPDGLSGEQIPLGARIISVCDTFDAMTSDRPYRKALPDQVAKEELQNNTGSQFDPELAKIFIENLDSIRAQDTDGN